MALFRIFNKRKNPTPTTSHQSTSQFPFSKDQVRVLLYKECDSKGRRLLFDSSAIQKVNLSNVTKPKSSNATGSSSSSSSSSTTNVTTTTTINASTSIANGQLSTTTTHQSQQNGTNTTNTSNKPSIQKPTTLNGNFVETSNGYGYKYVRPENSADNDYNNIGEMIFGSVAMSFRGTSLKVHWLQSPKRLLYSQVFLEPMKSNASTLLDTQAKMDVHSSMMVHTDSTSMNSLALSLSVLNLNGFGGGGGGSAGNGNLNGPKSICSCGGGGGGADKSHTNPLDVPFDTISDCGHTLAYSAGDSGYSGTDPWNVSCSSYCPYSSTRSSFCSVYSDRDSSRKLSIDSSINTDSCITTQSSDGNLQRRVLRNISTSFENRQSTSDFIGFISENLHQINTTNSGVSSNAGISGGNGTGGTGGGGGGVNGSGRSSTGTVGGGSDGCVTRAGRRCSEQVESRSNPEMFRKRGPGTHFSSFGGPPPHRNGASGGSNVRRPKLGLAVCISLNEQVSHEMQLFCSEHISLLELMLCRLRSTAENAYTNHKQFLKIMLHAWITTTTWLTDLFTAPRLSEPVWLTLSTGSSNNPSNLAHNFMSELCCLLTNSDTKDTNFFISKLLTAILTHHLGWVGTIAPITINNSNQTSSSFGNAADTDPAQSVSQFENEKLLEISKYHPYNVLWAQMGDLYGAIGNPPKISNTIICGNETNTIEKLLNVLTYFIRCGDIRREQRTELLEMDIINNIMETSKQNGDNKISNNNINDNDNNNNSNNIRVQNVSKTGGLTRTMTHGKDLQSLNAEGTMAVGESVEAINTDVLPQIEILKRNEIPNVLVYRNSRFVQQELRIGNFLMDTGIEMNTIQKLELKNYQKISSGEQIKLTVTNPDNEEFNVSSTDAINSSSTTTTTSPPIIDDVGEEAFDYSERQHQELRTRRLQQSNINENSNKIQDDILKTSLSLSDLITANNLGLVTHCTGSGSGSDDNNVNETRNCNGERKNSGIGPNGLFWNIETIKEGICLDQWQPIEKGIDIRNSTCMDNNCLSDGSIDTHSNTSFNDPQDQSELKRSKSLYTKSTNGKNENYRKLIKLTRKTSLTKNPEQHRLDHDEFEIIDIDNQQLKSHPSLSDLITANSVGVSERFTWGIEPVKESVCLEEEQHFELAKKMVEKEHDSLRPLPQQTSSTIVATASANAAIAAAHSAAASSPPSSSSSSAVLFVLGDDEALINLKNTMQSSTTTINENIKNSNNLQLNKLSINNNSNNVNNNNNSNNYNNNNNNNNQNNKNKNKPKKQCTHKKQHSGLKFDFVQHTPIFENYMKKKNIELTNLTDKSLKLNNNSDYNNIHSSSNILFSKLPQNYNSNNNNIDSYQNIKRYSNQNIENKNSNLIDKNSIPGDRVNNNHINIDDNNSNNNENRDGGENDDYDDDEEEEECDYCATSASISLQTPSNATELEFSTDDNSYPMFPSSTLSSKSSSTVTKAQSSSTPSTILSSPSHVIQSNINTNNNQTTNQTHQQQLQSQSQQQKQNELNSNNKMINNNNETTTKKKIQLNQQSSSNKQRNPIRFITLPMPKSKEYKSNSQNDNKTNNNNNNKDTKKLWDLEKRPGFIPSLFVGITDHYISDMVLQGTIAPSPTWEPMLKQNLRLASHCAILAQSRTENIAIIANTDNWDVKVVSSQTYVLACGSGTSGSIGMSQLVASMLETVHAMWTAGTPANQCISFIESKLHEMYLLSETLAALLLATEFCSLNTVTTALNLSENDVPLLLSVASIHSPQVTKKYGISFR